jgi:predicted nucleic acid-binding protein
MPAQLGVLDTSVFLAVFFPNDPNARRCADIIRALEDGRAVGWIDPLVVHELSYAAQRIRRFSSPAGIQEYVSSIIRLEGVQAEDKESLLEALSRWAVEGVSFVDAWLAVRAKGHSARVCTINEKDFPGTENTFFTADL